MHELTVAAGVLHAPDGRVLIAQRMPGTHMAGHWEFPGGKVAAGETPLQGLVRELREELGITVNYTRWLAGFTHEYPDRVVHLRVWSVLNWTGEPAGAEGQPLDWVAPEALLDKGLLPADEPIVRALERPGPSAEEFIAALV